MLLNNILKRTFVTDLNCLPYAIFKRATYYGKTFCLAGVYRMLRELAMFIKSRRIPQKMFLSSLHSNKYFGLKFRVFHVTNGTVFSRSLDY